MPEPDVQLRRALADRYRIERELGAGGMATVYVAEDLKDHRKVAIKVVLAHPPMQLIYRKTIRQILPP